MGTSGGNKKNTVVKTVNTNPTTLHTGPHTLPNDIVRSGNDGGSSRCLPLNNRRPTGMANETLRKTTEALRMAWSAELLPR